MYVSCEGGVSYRPSQPVAVGGVAWATGEIESDDAGENPVLNPVIVIYLRYLSLFIEMPATLHAVRVLSNLESPRNFMLDRCFQWR